MRILMPVTITILVLTIVGCAGGLKDTRPEADMTATKLARDWEKGPANPGNGLNGPSVGQGGTTFQDSMSLGSDGTNKGDPRNSAVVPTFNCNGDKEYCEVSFIANADLRDNEQIRVKVSAGPNKNAIGYIKKYTGGSSYRYRLSLREACGDDITVSFDWGNAGDNPANIESLAHIIKVEYSCVQIDQTNKSATGKLYDSDGNELNK